jgi:metallo-beta-lactamase family protein
MQSLMRDSCPILLPNMRMVRTIEQSKALNSLTMPSIIISASGMATGGRVVHHLRQRLDDPRNAVVFVGYQAQGTRGRLLQDGARQIEIYGDTIRVRASIFTLSGLSAHADSDEIMEWLGGFELAPRQTWLVHGEPEASAALAEAIRTRLGWTVDVARHLEEVAVAE